ncbi:MAG: glycosyltransferase family protein [Chitinophagaceae bacterium]
MEIFPQSLKWAKNKNIKLINYNPDNPFVFSGKGSGNSNVKVSMPLYDLHLTYNTDVKKAMESIYKIPTEILPFGFDISDALFNKCSMQQELNKVCFLGNPDIYRGKFLQKLAEEGIELDVYGNHWQKFVNHRNIKIFAPVYGDYFWLTLRKYRIQLNLMRPHNLNTHNMRSFEVPGVGGIQLAPDTPDHHTYFEPCKEIFLYTDIKNCVIQIKNILSLRIIDADKIREQARLRSLRSGYTYKNRASQALKYIRASYE